MQTLNENTGKEFRCKVYDVSTTGRNKQAIKEHIKEQKKEDILNEQLSIKGYVDPFKGCKKHG